MPKPAKGTRGGAREGAGRPPELVDPVRITIGFEREDLESLQTIGEGSGRSLASLVREGARLVILRHRRKRK
jgi:hypothetical protein